MNNYYNNHLFNKVSFTSQELSKTDFELCVFKDCNLSELHINGTEFLECQFINCNFSNARVKGSSFKEVKFLNSKLVGVKFYEINPFLFQANFSQCQLSYSSFYQLNMQCFQFNSCILKEVDFSEADLQNVCFENCDLYQATFNQTHLQNANFQTAKNFTIDIENNIVKGAIFSKETVGNLLEKYKIVIT